MPATIYLTPDIQGIEALSSSQIKEMQTSGFVEFGAHTMTHVNLTKADNDRAQKEIIQSKEAVEKLTGISCYSFAYPYGRYNEQHVQMVKNAGFTTAVTTKKAIAAFGFSTVGLQISESVSILSSNCQRASIICLSVRAVANKRLASLPFSSLILLL